MMMYASRTGTRRNLQALRHEGWRLLISPAGCVRHEGFPYALDNGAWTYHQRGTGFDGDAFMRAVDRVGERADWIVIPDRVGDAAGTFEMLSAWWPRLTGLGLLLFALQDGMSEETVRAVLRPGMGLFIGGSDDFKERTAVAWGRFSHALSLYLHMGRVNSARRIAIAAAAGCHSVDGTNASRFAVAVPRLSRARDQMPLRFARED